MLAHSPFPAYPHFESSQICASYALVRIGFSLCLWVWNSPNTMQLWEVFIAPFISNITLNSYTDPAYALRKMTSILNSAFTVNHLRQ